MERVENKTVQEVNEMGKRHPRGDSFGRVNFFSTGCVIFAYKYMPSVLPRDIYMHYEKSLISPKTKLAECSHITLALGFRDHQNSYISMANYRCGTGLNYIYKYIYTRLRFASVCATCQKISECIN